MTENNTKGEMVNLTAIFEHLFGTSEIQSKEDLDTLIKVLEEVGEDELDMEKLAQAAKNIQAQKEELAK